jgi:hypothetical protein
MNIGGQTVHSFFGFPPRPLIGNAEKPHWFFARTARAIRRLIIDEVSMLRADVLDAMNTHLQIARKSSRPFGGVQMLLVGDFYQLPPVVRGEEGQLLEDAGYASPYAFSAHVLRDAPVAAIQLTEVHRQTNQDFITLLSSIREMRGVEEAVTILNTVCLERSLPKRPVLLCATNAVADNYNARGLANLQGAAARARTGAAVCGHGSSGTGAVPARAVVGRSSADVRGNARRRCRRRAPYRCSPSERRVNPASRRDDLR